jgi:murein L,D-transpeptidase YafK
MGMRVEAPIFVRIFKEESQLEIWKRKDDGRFYHFKTYPICAWSGTLGPKVVVGDKQAPEGFYTISPGQLNPNSQFHLSFNLGYPNAFDRANGHTGDSLMVHGDCRSAGCFAMTDALIEEIYILAREAFQGGQTQFQVHAFPFHMTAENMARHRGDKWYGFWKTLKEGYDAFEIARIPPKVTVCSRQYLVNASFLGQVATPDPVAECPAYRKIHPEPFDPFAAGPVMARANGGHPQASRVASYTDRPGPVASTHAARAGAGQPQQAYAQPARQQPQMRAPQVDTGAERQAAFAAPRAQPQAVETVRPVDSGNPVSAAYHPQAVVQETPPAEAGPEVTRGLHNVVESSKGDMIVPRKGPGDQPQASEYGYGQTSTSGTGY